MTCESGTPAQGAAEAVARRSYGKLVALLATQTRDVDAAEDALAEAFSSALAHWPSTSNPLRRRVLLSIGATGVLHVGT